MKPMIAIIIPLGDAPATPGHDLPGMSRPVDPGFGIDAPPSDGKPPAWGGHPGTGPVWPERPTDPGWGQGHPLPPTVGKPPSLPPTVGGGPILPEPPPGIWPPGGVMPPIYDPTKPWPPVAGQPEPPIALPPPGVWPPKPPPGYVVVWMPGVGAVCIKLGVSVGGGPVTPPPAIPQPKT